VYGEKDDDDESEEESSGDKRVKRPIGGHVNSVKVA